MTYAAGELGRR